MNAITSRKGNPISRRTLRSLLVCKVIGSPSRSRFAHEFNILQIPGSRRRNIIQGGDTIPQLQDAGTLSLLFSGRVPSESYRVSIYVSIPLSRVALSRLADLSPFLTFTHLTGIRGNKQTVHACREIPLPIAETTSRNVREDKSRVYRRSLITLALRREISFR